MGVVSGPQSLLEDVTASVSAPSLGVSVSQYPGAPADPYFEER